MTINKYDKYALLPKKCDKCRRTFILEPYNIYYKQVGIDNFDLPQIYCKRCVEIKEKAERIAKGWTFTYDSARKAERDIVDWQKMTEVTEVE